MNRIEVLNVQAYVTQCGDELLEIRKRYRSGRITRDQLQAETLKRLEDWSTRLVAEGCKAGDCAVFGYSVNAYVASAV